MPRTREDGPTKGQINAPFLIQANLTTAPFDAWHCAAWLNDRRHHRHQEGLTSALGRRLPPPYQQWLPLLGNPWRSYGGITSLFVMAMIAMAGSATAQTTHPGAAGHDMKPQVVPADAQLKWTPSAVLPKGAEGAVLIGHPTKSGEIIIVRTKFPANYLAPAHTHPFTETITVISGSVGF